MDQSDISTIASRARRIVETLANEYPSRHGRTPRMLNGAAEFIEREFKDLGYVVQSYPYESEGTTVRNLVVEVKGSKPELSCIVVGAHYDTVAGTPGADDNASGIAGLIELARLQQNRPMHRTIRFVAFPHEEPPYFYTHLMGSRQYAEALRQKGEDVVVMLALEMLGYAGENYRQLYPAPFMRVLGRYPRYGDFIALVGNLRSLATMSIVRRAMRGQGTIGVESLSAPGFIPPLFLSDHSSFWKAGFPALMITDTAFLRNPHYHKESDTPDTLNYAFLAKVVSAVQTAVQVLGDQN
jgi:Zn-dependent M28 family amino/carboxypeptidase